MIRCLWDDLGLLMYDYGRMLPFKTTKENSINSSRRAFGVESEVECPHEGHMGSTLRGVC